MALPPSMVSRHFKAGRKATHFVGLGLAKDYQVGIITLSKDCSVREFVAILPSGSIYISKMAYFGY
ncbi:MAG: hypothetical protein UMV23_06870 [Halanaerobium sp.]|nr:hypothetical protein [Halanaerobium sp.]